MRKENGLCADCGKHPSLPEKVLCHGCLYRQRERYVRRKVTAELEVKIRAEILKELQDERPPDYGEVIGVGVEPGDGRQAPRPETRTSETRGDIILPQKTKDGGSTMDVGNQWVRTDIDFGNRLAWITVSGRQAAVASKLSLPSLAAEGKLEDIERVIYDLIEELRPEWAGGTLFAMKYRLHGMVWMFLYAHRSMPATPDHSGEFPEIPLVKEL
jgi:hypothetical protein